MKTFQRAVGLVLLVPIAILAIAFAVANRQVIAISFDPFSSGEPVFVLAAPLFLLVFLLLAAGVVIGGVASWLGQARYRTAARRFGAEAREAQAENARLRTELDILSRQNREEARLAGTAPAPLPALELHH
ncbi:lipopolysaccharide assembly protein LapA domain-containing protein [Lichenibacterium ramalinae]|uniref:lipopolysaccharide assembly protein LapA domain-containing protein n=1 Tax=Lichenibacterium ramalinae TaxID=2316527 RepID=UPI0013ECB63D|nr:lipopolysaccharide assembly protein LapA domain-containing protein [Lichenibacterium ramalinae]